MLPNLKVQNAGPGLESAEETGAAALRSGVDYFDVVSLAIAFRVCTPCIRLRLALRGGGRGPLTDGSVGRLMAVFLTASA